MLICDDPWVTYMEYKSLTTIFNNKIRKWNYIYFFLHTPHTSCSKHYVYNRWYNVCVWLFAGLLLLFGIYTMVQKADNLRVFVTLCPSVAGFWYMQHDAVSLQCGMFVALYPSVAGFWYLQHDAVHSQCGMFVALCPSVAGFWYIQHDAVSLPHGMFVALCPSVAGFWYIQHDAVSLQYGVFVPLCCSVPWCRKLKMLVCCPHLVVNQLPAVQGGGAVVPFWAHLPLVIKLAQLHPALDAGRGLQ